MIDRWPLSALAYVIAVLLATTAQAEAQTPLFLVNARTEVAAVKFDFHGSRSLEQDVLRDQIGLSGPTLGQKVRGFLAHLPLISSPTLAPFSPPELLRDEVRLERFYRRAGFPDASVRYEVSLDTLANRVKVTFSVREGQPTVLDTLEIVGPGGSPLLEALPGELRNPYRSFLDDLGQEKGQRLGTSLEIQLRDRVANWFRNRGYPFPEVDMELLDTIPQAHLVLQVDPGPRMRVGDVEIDGASVLAGDVIRREIPLEAGGWYSQSRLAEGQSELYGLDMVRLAQVQPRARDQGDSLVTIQVHIDEGRPRLVSGRLGYTTESGVSGDASWRHRDFLGGARVLEVSAMARTGFLGPESSVARRYGLSTLLQQPYLFHWRLEGIIRPFGEYRDEIRDRSIEGGFEGSILYRRGPDRTLTLRYGLTSRWILDARAGGPLGSGENLAELIRGVDTLDLDRRTSSLSLLARWGRSEDLRRRRWGWRGDASLELAGPPGLSTVEYGKVAGRLSLRVPFGQGFLFSSRGGFGRLFPYGASLPAPDGSDRLEIYLRLRDATLTAGGPYDVRGWGVELLGPKVPDFRISEGDASQLRADRYLPLGGLARWTGSLELEAPFPFLGRPHGVHVFLDAGRIWTPDNRFLPREEPLLPGELDDAVRFGTGLGVSFATPVGPVQVDLGYKLNPSTLDLRNPGAVARALEQGRDLEQVKEHGFRRWHLHLSMGGIR